MWFCKGHDLERSRSLGKINGTVSFLDLKNIDLDIKIFVPSALVQTLLSKTSFCIMVANVMRHVRHTFKPPKMFFHLLKGLNPCYLVLKFGNILPINNWDMAQNVISQRSWPWKVKVTGQNKWHHQIPWPRNIYLNAKIIILCALSFKVMVKDVILHNGGQRNVFAYVSCSRSRS